MRSLTTSRHGSRSMEVERPKIAEEPHLVDVNMRSLMKKLGSWRHEEQKHMNPVFSDGAVADGSPSNLAKIGGGLKENQQQQQQEQEHQQQPSQSQPQYKKQVRRRLHTSRPYQERLLNMAQARREIVAALKSHRAAMKRAGEQKQQQQKRLQQEAPPHSEGKQKEMRTRKIIRAYPSNTTSNCFFNHFNNTPLSYPQFSWVYNSVSTVPFPENLNLIFPFKPLGLNLNYHDFNNMHTTLHSDESNPPIHHSSSSCSYYASSASGTMSALEDPLISDGPPRASGVTSGTSSGALHLAKDDEEMAGIRTIGDHQKMERNGKLQNSATSAWWCKFLETKEISPQVPEAGNGEGGTGGDVLHMFDEALEIPAWLGDQQHLHEYYSEDYLQDVVLPCLDIGEIEVMDCEWLS